MKRLERERIGRWIIKRHKVLKVATVVMKGESMTKFNWLTNQHVNVTSVRQAEYRIRLKHVFPLCVAYIVLMAQSTGSRVEQNAEKEEGGRAGG